MSDKNLPAVQEKQLEATKLVQKYRSENALVFVRDEDLKSHPLFLPEVTILKATKDDFHNIQNSFMPKSYQTDRIGEATGITFIADKCGTRKEGDSVYVGWSTGKKRQPDGTWRESHKHEYEFDVEVRAELDFANKPDKYQTDQQKQVHKLELKKFARQRAGTGAHLKVIRELVGIPISFKPNEIQKTMVFCRTALNTNEMLSDPEMREAVIKHALGATEEIFGPAERNVTPEKESLPEPDPAPAPATEKAESTITMAPPEEEGERERPFEDDIPWEEDELTIVRRWFDFHIEDKTVPEKTRNWIRDLLAGKSGKDLATLTKYKDALESKLAKVNGGAK